MLPLLLCPGKQICIINDWWNLFSLMSMYQYHVIVGFVGLMQLSVERLSSMKKYVFGFGSAQVCETSSLHFGQLFSGAYVSLIFA